MSAHRFFVNGPTGKYQAILDLVGLLGPARLVFYRVKSGSSPATADVVTILLWSGDVVEGVLDDTSAVRPLVSTLLSDFPIAIEGHVAGIAI